MRASNKLIERINSECEQIKKELNNESIKLAPKREQFNKLYKKELNKLEQISNKLNNKFAFSSFAYELFYYYYYGFESKIKNFNELFYSYINESEHESFEGWSNCSAKHLINLRELF